LREQNVNHIYLSYFGGGDPHAYGIRYVAVAPRTSHTFKDDADPAIQKEKKILFVISATNREGLYYRNHALFAWLKKRQPVARLAKSLWVYDISQDADAHEQLAVIFAQTHLKDWVDFEKRWARSIRAQRV
jgi:hypothetical protein